MTLTRLNPTNPTDALVDNRQSEKAAEICRGVMRVLALHGLTGLIEVTLPNGRRADVMALSASGAIWIIEIKSSVMDFQVDQKWPEYRDYCDALFFAVATDFPQDILPAGNRPDRRRPLRRRADPAGARASPRAGAAQGGDAALCPRRGGASRDRLRSAGPHRAEPARVESELRFDSTSVRAWRGCAAASGGAC